MPLPEELNQAVKLRLVPQMIQRIPHSGILPRQRGSARPLREAGGGSGSSGGVEEQVGGGGGSGGSGGGGVILPPSAPLNERGQLYPVAMTINAGSSEVDSLVSDPLQGPLVIEYVSLVALMAAGGSGFWNMVRLDFSDSAGLDTFTFNTNGYPTGTPTGRLTLFDKGRAWHSETTSSNNNNGWLRVPFTTTSASLDLLRQPVAVVIPWSPVYLKLYVQNDEAAVKQYQLMLSVRQLQAADVGQTQQTISPVSSPAVGGQAGLPPGRLWTITDWTLKDKLQEVIDTLKQALGPGIVVGANWLYYPPALRDWGDPWTHAAMQAMATKYPGARYYLSWVQ